LFKKNSQRNDIVWVCIPPYDVITHFSKKPVPSICPIYMEDTICDFLKSDSRSCRESRDQQYVVPSHARRIHFFIGPYRVHAWWT